MNHSQLNPLLETPPVLVSVVIPSYNRADTVSQTLDSILQQQVNADIEIIVGDDCSPDPRVKTILDSYSNRFPDIVKVFYREKNMRLGANWAQCIKDSHGEFICNCDNDDYWHNPHKLQIQLDYMRQHPECNICITDHRTHNRMTGKILEEKAYYDHSVPIQKAMWGGCHFCNATIMYRAAFLKEHLDLDEWIRRSLSLQDWPAWVILTAYTGIDIIPVSTATFGIETVSITRPDTYEHYESRLERDKEVCAYLGELFPQEFPYSDKMWECYQNHCLMMMAFRNNDFPAAKRYGQNASSSFHQKISQHRLLFNTFMVFNKAKKLLKKMLLKRN